MEKIEVLKQEKVRGGWSFTVQIGEGENITQHVVSLSDLYWKTLTRGHLNPSALVKKSFEFLLARESKESILGQFQLSDIQTYFPEYEDATKEAVE